MADKGARFIDFFSQIPDHRLDRRKLHHWVLDICFFNDDQMRIRKGNAPRNIAIVKKTVLNLLNIIKQEKPSIRLKRMRKLAGWDHQFLDAALMAKF